MRPGSRIGTSGFVSGLLDAEAALDEAVDLRRHREIPLRQAADIVTGEGDDEATPADLEVRGVPLRRGQEGDARGEAEGRAERAEPELTHQPVIEDPPAGVEAGHA